MSATELMRMYRRFGPILFSHFYRRLNDETQAIDATRSAFEELVATRLRDDEAVVRWVRAKTA